MKNHQGYIAIGSNLGDRQRQIDAAIQALHDHPAIHVIAVSRLHEYPALTLTAGEQQPPYLNGVIHIDTTLTPVALLEVLQMIEKNLGRIRSATTRWASRTMDLDIVTFDDLILTTEALTIPHPELHKRWFVLEPLAEIAPTWVHPRLGKTAQQLLEHICNFS